MAFMIRVKGSGYNFAEPACQKCANGVTREGLPPDALLIKTAIPDESGIVCDWCGEYADGTENPDNPFYT